MAKKDKPVIADVERPAPVVEEPFDAVVASQAPVCEEKTGHVIKMNFYNAAGQLIR